MYPRVIKWNQGKPLFSPRKSFKTWCPVAWSLGENSEILTILWWKYDILGLSNHIYLHQKSHIYSIWLDPTFSWENPTVNAQILHCFTIRLSTLKSPMFVLIILNTRTWAHHICWFVDMCMYVHIYIHIYIYVMNYVCINTHIHIYIMLYYIILY